MIRLFAITALVLATSPAAAQSHPEHMPGMTMPEPAAKQSAKAAPRPARPVTPAGQAAQPTPVDPSAGHTMPGMVMPAAPADATLPVGDAPPPPAVAATYADRIWGAQAMQGPRARIMAEHGGGRFGQLFFDLAEVAVRGGRDGYRWDGEAWYGGDIDRVVVKSDGDGSVGGSASADVQLLYSHAIGPYFDLQAGVRQDLTRGPSRTWAALGIEGLAPYWIMIDATAFLSQRGELLAEIEGHYDQRITQRLILQPRAELKLAAQDVPRQRIGAGLSTAELGLRLRYEITRRFAPYVGVSYEAKTGATARYARADGDDPTSTSLVAGIRFWL